MRKSTTVKRKATPREAQTWVEIYGLPSLGDEQTDGWNFRVVDGHVKLSLRKDAQLKPIPPCGECGSQRVVAVGYFNRVVRALGAYPPKRLSVKVKRWHGTIFCKKCFNVRRDLSITVGGGLLKNSG